jgi:hypothetical protein
LSLLLSCLAILSLCNQARAHRLEAEYHVLPGHKVSVESWFDLTGDSPVGASVVVYKTGGDVLTSGELDKEGLFVFAYAHSEPLRIVVSAGAGHRKELLISAAELPGKDAVPSSPAATAPNGPLPRADRSSRVDVKDVLLGLGLLLAVAAFALALGNARKLRALDRKLQDRDGR